MEKKDSDYTSDSWNKFQKALESAKDVLKDDNATQQEVDQALNELEDAEKRLISAD